MPRTPSENERRQILRYRRLLLTGFGPFPGVPDNLSARLVRRLAPRARERFPGLDVHAAILPVTWTEAPRRLHRLIERHQPDIALHFGVSAAATGFVIETCAQNIAAAKPDARRSTPAAATLSETRPGKLEATLEIARILHALDSQGFPAILSNDAGHYLCNAILYASLDLAEQTRQASERPAHRAAFIHIPAAPPRDLDLPRLLAGSLEIIATALA